MFNVRRYLRRYHLRGFEAKMMMTVFATPGKDGAIIEKIILLLRIACTMYFT